MPMQREYVEIPLAGQLGEDVAEQVAPSGILARVRNMMQRPAGQFRKRPTAPLKLRNAITTENGFLSGATGLYQAGNKGALLAAAYFRDDATAGDIPALIPWRGVDTNNPWGDMSPPPLTKQQWLPIAADGTELSTSTGQVSDASDETASLLLDFAVSPNYYYVLWESTDTVAVYKLWIWDRVTGTLVYNDTPAGVTTPQNLIAGASSGTDTDEVLVVGITGANIVSVRLATEHDSDGGDFATESAVTIAAAGAFDCRDVVNYRPVGGTEETLGVLVRSYLDTTYFLGIHTYSSANGWTAGTAVNTSLNQIPYPYIGVDAVEPDDYALFYFDPVNERITYQRVYEDLADERWELGTSATAVDLTGEGYGTYRPRRFIGARVYDTDGVAEYLVAVQSSNDPSLAFTDVKCFRGAPATKTRTLHSCTIHGREWRTEDDASPDLYGLGVGGRPYTAVGTFVRADSRQFGTTTVRDSRVWVGTLDGIVGIGGCFEGTRISSTISNGLGFTRSFQIDADTVLQAFIEHQSSESARVVLARFTHSKRSPRLQTQGLIGGGNPVVASQGVEAATLPPPAYEITITGSGGALTAGTYGIAVVAERTSLRGDRIRSAPAFGEATVSASGYFEVDIQPVEFERQPDIVRYEVFVTPTPTSDVFVWQGVGSITDDTGETPLNIELGKSAAFETAGEVLYTTGGVLSNNQPPFARDMAVSGSRVFILDGVDSWRVWVSKPKVEGLSWEWSAFTSLVFPDPLVAISSMDGRLIAFSEEAVYAVGGSGPDSTGLGVFSPPERLSVGMDVGCIARDSVVEIEQGIVFRSRRGYQLLTRGLQVVHVGDPVRDLEEDEVRAVPVLKYDHTRFYRADTTALVWSSAERSPGWTDWGVISDVGTNTFVDVIQRDGVVYMMQSTGAMRIEQASPTVGDDASDFTFDVETGWIKLPALTGFSRIHWMYLLGEYRAAHTLTVDVYYDYESTSSETFTRVLTSSPDDYLMRFKPARQKATAVKIRVRDSNPTGGGESAVLTALGIQYLRKSKTPRGSAATL